MSDDNLFNGFKDRSIRSQLSLSTPSFPSLNLFNSSNKRVSADEIGLNGRKGESDSGLTSQTAPTYKRTKKELLDTLADNRALPRPVDPVTLQDLAGNPIVQAYIDTLAKDVSALPWTIESRDDADVDTAQFERDLETLPADKSFNDFIEATANDVLEVGNTGWIIRFSRGEVSEVIAPDPASLYKTRGGRYVQGTRVERDPDFFDDEEIVWFEWQSSNKREYAAGPVELGRETIKRLDQIIHTDLKHLEEGNPPGFLRISESVSDDDYADIKEDWNLSDGETYRGGVLRADEAAWEPITDNYKDMELLARYKNTIQELGSLFKVNPSYAGFNFDETNRATDESQRESYEQRGLRVIASVLEDRINQELIWPYFSEDVEFTFKPDAKSDAEEKENRIERVDQMASAAKKMRDAGIEFELEDGVPVPVAVQDEVEGQDVRIEASKQHLPSMSKGPKMMECEECYGMDVRQVVEELEERHENRSAAISELDEKLESGLTRKTYYDWLERFELK